MEHVPSAAAQILIAVIPIVGIVMGSTVAFFFLLWNYRQKVKLIEQGLVPPSTFDLETFALLTGLLSAGVGAVLTVFFLLMEGISYVTLGGVIPLAVGIGLLLFPLVRRTLLRR